jgi:N-acetylmuramoyl-L-alanine amidase
MRASGSQNILDITLTPTGKSRKPEAEAEKSHEPEKKTDKKPAQKDKPPKPVTSEPAKDKFIVVIDPGHGGKDPGAVGSNGTCEKDVVLEVARKLKARIDREKGMRAILTRDSDRFIPLRSRMDIAHENKANLFISVHADANPSSRVSGSSVYILSEMGASSEAARLLAESENSYELKFGNRSLNNTSDRIASVLLDLSQNAMMDRSLSLAKGVLTELSKVNDPLRRGVESARFVVLRSPDIPSMLVETAFISNPGEEKRLRTAAYQQKLATAVFKGVKRYQIAYAESDRQNT